MNNERISKLHALLHEEFRKATVDHNRIAEINYYLSQEFLIAPESEVPPAEPSAPWWSVISLPPNWKTYVTMGLGALVAMNSQLQVVPQNVQDALLAGAVALGFWAVNGTQALHLERIKDKLNMFGQRMGVAPPTEEEKKKS